MLLHEIPAIDGADFRTTMAQVPTFVSVITTVGPAGCTANAVLSLSASPPRMLVSLARGSRTAERVRAGGCFAVNVLTWAQRELVSRFGGAPPERRFDGVEWAERAGVPVITGSAAVLVCRLDSTIPVGDHALLIGTAIWTHHREGQVPLVLHRREAHALHRPAA